MSLGAAVAVRLSAAWRRARKMRRLEAAVALPLWLQWLEEDPRHYRVLLREWEDVEWRKECGWKGWDLIHGANSAVHIPCYFYSPKEKALRGPIHFREGSESHRGLCHGGAMTSAMDDVLGHLCFLASSDGPWNGATVQVNCNLKRPVRVGQTLYIEGRVVRQEKKKVFIEATLSDENGDVYAVMEGISIAGANLQKDDCELYHRKWIYNEDKRTLSDSGWASLTDAPHLGG